MNKIKVSKLGIYMGIGILLSIYMVFLPLVFFALEQFNPLFFSPFLIFLFLKDLPFIPPF